MTLSLAWLASSWIRSSDTVGSKPRKVALKCVALYTELVLWRLPEYLAMGSLTFFLRKVFMT